MRYLEHYGTPFGPVTFASDGQRLSGLWFEGQRYYPEELRAAEEAPELPVFAETRRWLDLYFSGREPGFLPELAPAATAFRAEVREILLTVPYGSTVTYGEIARKLEEKRPGRRVPAQAVGGAVGHNEISILVPCHRVIGADGSLTGYAGGLERKQGLMALERRRGTVPGEVMR